MIFIFIYCNCVNSATKTTIFINKYRIGSTLHFHVSLYITLCVPFNVNKLCSSTTDRLKQNVKIETDELSFRYTLCNILHYNINECQYRGLCNIFVFNAILLRLKNFFFFAENFLFFCTNKQNLRCIDKHIYNSWLNWNVNI